MTELWRRQDIEEERARIVGRTNRGSHGYVLRETAFGRVVDSATFECDPCSGPRERVRLWIAVRDGVGIFNRGYVPTMQRIEEKRSDNCIALGARGGHQDHYYTWVQIFSEDTEETVHDFRGGSRTENVAGEEERNWNRYGFEWDGREWGVDAGNQGDNPTSARYAQMGFDLSPEGWSNGEIIYDEPVPLAWYQWMRERAEVARVEGTMRFHSFLFGIPLDRGSTGQRIFEYRQEPVASVAWSCDMGVRRETVGGELSYVSNVYRVHFIMPNGVIPPGLRSVMWRVFLGR